MQWLKRYPLCKQQQQKTEYANNMIFFYFKFHVK